jgi:hypothetical protein
MIAEIILLIKTGLSGSSENNMTHKKTVKLFQELSLRKSKPHHKRAALHTVSKRGFQRDYVGAGGYESSEASGRSWTDIVGATISPQEIARRDALLAQTLKPIDRVRAEGTLAAIKNVSGKRFFGFGRIHPAPDIEPQDEILTLHADDLASAEKWLSIASSDPSIIWAGIFDMTTHKLIREATGKSITVGETAAPVISSGAGAGLAVAAVGSVFAFAMLKSKKR